MVRLTNGDERGRTAENRAKHNGAERGRTGTNLENPGNEPERSGTNRTNRGRTRTNGDEPRSSPETNRDEQRNHHKSYPTQFLSKPKRFFKCRIFLDTPGHDKHKYTCFRSQLNTHPQVHGTIKMNRYFQTDERGRTATNGDERGRMKKKVPAQRT